MTHTKFGLFEPNNLVLFASAKARR